KILVIEDDDGIRHVLREILRDEGYEVHEAGDGKSALDELQNWTPSAIILDLMMPTMDGRSFRSEQRSLQRAADVPLLVLSASRQLGMVKDLGAAAVITKPFEIEEVVSVINSLHPGA